MPDARPQLPCATTGRAPLPPHRGRRDGVCSRPFPAPSGFRMPTAAPAKPPAFMKALKPSPALAAVVGSEPLPRTAVTKALWDYIKKHNLQNPDNKRNILCD